MMDLMIGSDTASNWVLCKLKLYPKESVSVLFPFFFLERSPLTSAAS